MREYKEIARQSTARGGSSDIALDAFIDNILQTKVD